MKNWIFVLVWGFAAEILSITLFGRNDYILPILFPLLLIMWKDILDIKDKLK